MYVWVYVRRFLAWWWWRYSFRLFLATATWNKSDSVRSVNIRDCFVWISSGNTYTHDAIRLFDSLCMNRMLVSSSSSYYFIASFCEYNTLVNRCHSFIIFALEITQRTLDYRWNDASIYNRIILSLLTCVQHHCFFTRVHVYVPEIHPHIRVLLHIKQLYYIIAVIWRRYGAM